ncbi:glycoside hydrolase family 92 protein [Diplodia corticola]|uniref:Glycoside hydrolase family 92 protein n=1 Tax=Diplodia corticola TaxID=236234 RepID=A0A1J9QQ93_9PEZI|nr:glycoside hydrolase family 92 protein [Diplodia corticola]OJD30632.1 glycoside hydrolase family 92 protein [Diplodia corticola]
MAATFAALTLLLASANRAFGQGTGGYQILDFVDPLIGTVNGGHVFPGATLPFGMAKAVADVGGDGELQAGFASDDSPIAGFSHMHDSGTGGSPSLGNFPLFPHAGCPGDDVNNCEFPATTRAVDRINGTAFASPGYFTVTLNTSIKAETTVTNHTALWRFTFPEVPVSPNGDNTTIPLSPLILVDLKDLPNSRSHGQISVDPDTGRITGNGTFAPSFGIGTYNLSFCASFKGATIRETGVFMNNRAGNEPKSLQVVPDNINTDSETLPAGAWVHFEAPSDGQILARVGVSFISADRACQHAETEIPDYDFDTVHAAAEEAWREKLSVVSIDPVGVNKSLQRTFWSGLYRTMISPQDYTGENYLWESDEPYYDSFYYPYSQTQMIRTLIDIYRHEGWLPDCRMSLCKGFTQGGSNADVILVDSFLKNITQDVDWETGYEALIKDAEDEPLNWAVEGRGGLTSWKSLGYIPADDYDPLGVGPFTRSISRTVEYAYNDYVIALMAQRLGKTGDYEKYLERSSNWKNMFKEDEVSFFNTTPGGPKVDSGFTGFLQVKYLNGSWGYQDPILCSSLYNFTSCYLNPDGHETYEGSIWLYTFYVPQDMATLITTLGGPETFTRRVEFLHYTYNLLYIGDEQAFLTIYLAHYSGRPAVSAEIVHSYLPAQFNDTIIGIPGNDDSGSMGSASSFFMMGFFPQAGQDVYFITPPFFREVNITSPVTGKTATIRNVGFDPEYRAIYVQSATLDGVPYAKNWFTHAFFLDGGVLELTLGRNESDWGTREEDLPPSASTAG